MNRGRFAVRGRARGHGGNPGGARMEGRHLREDEPGLWRLIRPGACTVHGTRAAHRVNSKRMNGSTYREDRGMGWTAWADADRSPHTEIGNTQPKVVGSGRRGERGHTQHMGVPRLPRITD